jgi:SsrA-binding protein
MAEAREIKAPDRVQVVAQNRRAKFDYKIEEKVEAGLALTGAEVKDLRDGQANLSDSYGLPKNGELYLLNARIGNAARHAGAFAPEPTRSRKLLLHRAEIDRWTSKVRERGYSIIPLVLYFKNGRAKVELALVTGKTHEDRRQDIKERETKRELDRAMSRRR